MTNTNLSLRTAITTNYRTITHVLHSINSGRVGQNADVKDVATKGRWTKFDKIETGTICVLRCSEPGRQGVYAVGLIITKDQTRFVDTTTWPDFSATHLMQVDWLITGGADSYVSHTEVEKIISHKDMMIQPAMALNTYQISDTQIMDLIRALNDKKIQSSKRNPLLKVA